jgi:hypothetical protein
MPSIVKNDLSTLDVEGFFFDLVVMPTTSAVFNDVEEFATVLLIVDDPFFKSPTFGYNV